MSDETDGQQAGTGTEAAQVEAPQVEAGQETVQDPEDTAGQDTGTDNTGQADEAGDQPKRKPWWEKRFDELTAKRYEAERQADYWRGLAEGRSGQGQPQPAQQAGPPREDQFERYEDYESARIEYAVEQRLKTARDIEQREAAARTFQDRVTAVRDKLPDYDLYVGDPTLPITPLMAEVIRESDVGPEVAYHLGKNRTEATRIANLPPHRQAAELGRLEARLGMDAQQAAAPSRPRPVPPAPPQTVSGLSAGLTKAPEDMSMDEYIAWRAQSDKT